MRIGAGQARGVYGCDTITCTCQGTGAIRKRSTGTESQS